MSDHLDNSHSVFVYYAATVRVEVDLQSQQVEQVIVDTSTMLDPSTVRARDGREVIGADRERAQVVASTAEWPSWDYELLPSDAETGPLRDAAKSELA